MEDIVGSSHWIDSYNSSWTREDLHLMLSLGGTQFLYEKLAANGELDTKLLFAPVLKAPRRASRWKVVDFEKKMVFPLIPRSLTVDAGFHFKNSIDVKDFEAMTSGLLELQVKQSRRILSQADIVSLINQKVQVFNRMGYAYRCIFQRKLKSPSSSREVQDQNSSSNIPSSTRSSPPRSTVSPSRSSPNNFASSQCYQPPTPSSLPKPPVAWTASDSSVNSCKSKGLTVVADPTAHLKLLLNVQA